MRKFEIRNILKVTDFESNFKNGNKFGVTNISQPTVSVDLLIALLYYLQKWQTQASASRQTSQFVTSIYVSNPTSS